MFRMSFLGNLKHFEIEIGVILQTACYTLHIPFRTREACASASQLVAVRAKRVCYMRQEMAELFFYLLIVITF